MSGGWGIVKSRESFFIEFFKKIFWGWEEGFCDENFDNLKIGWYKIIERKWRFFLFYLFDVEYLWVD